MKVGETYEVHWPHSALGACGTVNQYQTPFYDGVFCNADPTVTGAAGGQGEVDLTGVTDFSHAVGVQSQTFTIVNDEAYYYPDLMRGMIVDANHGKTVTGLLHRLHHGRPPAPTPCAPRTAPSRGTSTARTFDLAPKYW
jgi:hypothetical protein